MEIAYKREEVKKEIQKLLESENVSVKYSQYLVSRFDGPILFGNIFPPMDFGFYDLTFNITKDVAIGIAGNAIWDLIKKSFVLLKSKAAANKEEKLVIQTDEYYASRKANVYFIFSSNLPEQEIFEGIEKIPDIRTKVLNLLDSAHLFSSDLGFEYRENRWWLETPRHYQKDKTFFKSRFFIFFVGIFFGVMFSWIGIRF